MSTKDPGFEEAAWRVKALFGYSKPYADDLTNTARENVCDLLARAWDEGHADYADHVNAGNPYRDRSKP